MNGQTPKGGPVLVKATRGEEPRELSEDELRRRAMRLLLEGRMPALHEGQADVKEALEEIARQRAKK